MGFELSLTPASPSTRQFTPCRVLLLEEMIGLRVPLTIRPIIDDGSVPSFTPFCNVTVRYDGNDVRFVTALITLNANHWWQGYFIPPTLRFSRYHTRRWGIYRKHQYHLLSFYQ